MATKKLANELGLVRQRRRPSNENNEKQILCGQLFSYLVVIDFESTCWADKNNYGQEIIEFPAVVLNTRNGKIESEFHTYVQPQEHPILSKFCTELTGIRQEQVEAGVPLHVCLSLFTRWIKTLQEEKNIVFVQEKACSYTGHPCAFVTWSDWDFGVCLQYECKRKQICKPDILNSWIDLRATYKLFYNRKPKGLNGALQDLGITFSGREHSGLDDARNTAHLAWRMVTDGCLMKVTSSLDRAPVQTKPLLQMNPNTGNVGQRSMNEEGIKPFLKQPKRGLCEQEAESSENKHNPEVSSNREICQYQSWVLPKDFSHSLSTTVVKGKPSVPTPASHFGSKRSPLSGTAVSLPKSNLVLVATTIGCNTNVHEADANLNTDPATLSCEWSETPFIEAEDSRSYDDVILEDSDSSADHLMDTFSSHQAKGVEHNTECSLVNASSSHSKPILFKNSNTTVYSLEKCRLYSSSSGVFKTPLLSNGKLKGKSIPLSHMPCSAKPKVNCGPEKPEKYSGPNMSTPTRSFTVYKDEDDSIESRLSSGRLSSVPSLPSSSSVNRMSLPSRGTMKMTSPLCTCGRRAKRLTVGNGGPNHGRVFFSCPIGKMGSGIKKSCGFFKWESSLLKAASSTLASHSLCSVPGTSLTSSGKSFINNSFSSHTNFVRRPSLRN